MDTHRLPPGRDEEGHGQRIVRHNGPSSVSMADVTFGFEAPPPEDARFALFQYGRILRERWRIVAGSFLVVTAAVAVGLWLTPPVYRAIGTIEIRKQASEVVPMDALFQYERISDQYLQTEYGTLRSRALLERTLEEGGLRSRLLSALGEGDPSPAPDRAAGSADVALTEAMRDRIVVTPVVGSRIIRVGFDSPDPVLSADVVNALIAQHGAMRRAAGDAALGRLAAQADSVRLQLLDAERDLQVFVNANGLGPMVIGGPNGETVPQERLRRLQQELTAAETEGYQAAARSSAARGYESATESELLRTLRVRMAELEGEYARARSTFRDSFPRMRQLRSELAQLDSLVAVEQARVSGRLASEHEAAIRRRQLLQAAVDEQRETVGAFAALLAEYDRRQRDVSTLKDLYGTLQQKGREAAISSALSEMDIAVLDAATPPMEPLRPRPKRDLPLAAMTGLLLGIGLAFLREYADPTVRRPEEFHDERVPLLGAIPAVRSTLLRSAALPAPRGRAGHRGRRHPTGLDGHFVGDSPMAEAFRGLRTAMLFDAGGPLPRTLVVTSIAPGDGKTTISTNFAISLTLVGHRVLLADADLRRPSLHRMFGRQQGPGLSDYLEGRLPWQRARVQDVRPGLDLLPAGRPSVSPSDLLSSAAADRWLEEATEIYDFVILDAPALHIAAPDARILAHAAKGVLLVIRSGSAPRDLVARVVAQTPNLVGVILNQLRSHQLPAYYGSPVAAGARDGEAGADGPGSPAVATS